MHLKELIIELASMLSFCLEQEALHAFALLTQRPSWHENEVTRGKFIVFTDSLHVWPRFHAKSTKVQTKMAAM